MKSLFDEMVCFHPGRNNYSVFAGKTVEETEKEFEGKGYGEFKLAVGETVADAMEPIRAKKAEILADRTYLDGIMQKGADQANYLARKMISKVYRKVGLYSPERKK